MLQSTGLQCVERFSILHATVTLTAGQCRQLDACGAAVMHRLSVSVCVCVCVQSCMEKRRKGFEEERKRGAGA